jgi:hypothetical protein
LKRADALQSLVRRRILNAETNRVSLQVALLLSVLAKPALQVSVSRHGTTAPHLVLAIQNLTHVAHSMEDHMDVITPHEDAVSRYFTIGSPTSDHGFSLPGRTWHDMVAQARFANEQQLARMAELDGTDTNDAIVAAHLAKHHGEREDARVLSYRGNSRWRGTELSWIPDGESHWLVDDGGRFGMAADLAGRRATFSRSGVGTAVKAALLALDKRV